MDVVLWALGEFRDAVKTLRGPGRRSHALTVNGGYLTIRVEMQTWPGFLRRSLDSETIAGVCDVPSLRRGTVAIRTADKQQQFLLGQCGLGFPNLDSASSQRLHSAPWRLGKWSGERAAAWRGRMTVLR
jgi:hypothetical protein